MAYILTILTDNSFIQNVHDNITEIILYICKIFLKAILNQLILKNALIYVKIIH